MTRNTLRHVHVPMTSTKSGTLYDILPDVMGLTVKIVNVYFIGDPESNEGWVLVDAGVPHETNTILEAAVRRFGEGARPRAILLTHGHFDHVGCVVELAEHWDVPVYAHPLEIPYLTGEARYPDPDSQVEGGMVASMSRFFPTQPIDLSSRIEMLPEDRSVPAMPGWRWVPTPGHSPGHVSFFRDEDRALIVGDAFVTVRQDELYQVLTQRQELSGPPRYFTPDWNAARDSVRRLAELAPEAAMTGHGIPMKGEAMRRDLNALADDFDNVARPAYGHSVDNDPESGD
ncbi:MBL fold metallo-hydrolase [Billgrantia bachuensis]|uniref:MBL fold metallo-hydrolase n=1 Tax=Billgrantia bachuensis TaxID=2717286 RepID=A0ABX0PVW5_9GAMM|nr:MBL fold metallo-hydrolase [Halomonas bachuensis]NIC07410.1 MBL fold metallo-hydrolase [Halomonas bachuensis]